MIATPACMKLISKLRPVPTIMPESLKRSNMPPVDMLETIKTPRKANDSKTTSWKSVEWFQEERLNQFIGDFVSKVPKRCEKGIIFDSKEDFCLSYKRLFSTWWTSNLKFSNNNQIIHTAVIGDGKCPFVRSFEAWREEWKKEKISNGQKFDFFLKLIRQWSRHSTTSLL